MKKYCLVFLVMIVGTTCAMAQQEDGKAMKYEKVIYESSKTHKEKLLSTPDSISGLWNIGLDKQKKTFEAKKGKYYLIINNDEKNGTAVFFDENDGKILEKINVKINRIDIGTYEMKYKNTKRIFKIVYTAYDGNMYFYYEDSKPLTEDNRKAGSCDGSFSTRDYSDKALQALINNYIETSDLNYDVRNEEQ